ncbi:hypothetical protein TNCV_949061 [Trichonephila clavipes]|nr:hypothetical protein TNCV_949061 [Trichonephila clavipes]
MEKSFKYYEVNTSLPYAIRCIAKDVSRHSDISVAIDGTCGLAKMEGDHVPRRTGLAEYPADDIISWYWESRRQMVKKPDK